MIYINGRFLNKKMVGVTRFASEILRCFDKEEYVDQIEVLIPKNCVGYHTPNFLKTRVIGKLKGNLWEQISLPRFLRKQKDVRLLNLCNASPLFFKGFSVVHDISFIHLASTYSWAFTRWYRYMIKKKVKDDYLIFTVSEFSKNDIASFYKIDESKIIVTPCGIDHICRVDKDDDVLNKYDLINKDYNLYVGSTFKHKNTHLIEELAKQDKDHLYVFVSKNDGKALSENIKFIEEDLSLPSLKSLYEHANTLFMVSSYEGFGIPPLEALVSGTKHVVLSSIPVFKEIYKDKVDYVPVGENIVLKQYKDIDDETKQYFKDNYSWNKSADIILKKIKSFVLSGDKK